MERTKELKTRIVRVVEFVAESLDAEANAMPPSYRDRAEAMHKMADTIRQSSNPRKITVSEEQ